MIARPKEVPMIITRFDLEGITRIVRPLRAIVSKIASLVASDFQ